MIYLSAKRWSSSFCQFATCRCSSTSFSAMFSRNRYSVARSTAERRFFSSLVMGQKQSSAVRPGDNAPMLLQNPYFVQKAEAPGQQKSAGVPRCTCCFDRAYHVLTTVNVFF